MEKDNMTDKELERLLLHVEQPALPDGFAARLQARLEQVPTSNVVNFSQRQKPKPKFWLSAVPLAASLVMGLYLGASGDVRGSLASYGVSLVSDASDDISNTGFEDTEAFLNGDLS